ncbi:hypothetical protein [Nonomuraea salmonea]|uniref:hypothetical protein n=1 Tax=Nonomuraea salmonea TaxID=46181 RepID=UPI0031EE7D81
MRAVEAAFAGELARVQPGLSGRYAAELPGARAAVMGRLWRGLLYEPLPGLRAAGPGCVVLADGRRLIGPERRPYDVRDEPELLLDGRPRTHPAALLEALALPGTAALVEDLDNSVASLALSRAGASKEAPKTAEEHEQSVIDGHPYHPGCRNRPGGVGGRAAGVHAGAPPHRPPRPAGPARPLLPRHRAMALRGRRPAAAARASVAEPPCPRRAGVPSPGDGSAARAASHVRKDAGPARRRPPISRRPSPPA